MRTIGMLVSLVFVAVSVTACCCLPIPNTGASASVLPSTNELAATPASTQAY